MGKLRTIASWDGATANNPCPSWWEAEKIQTIDGVVFLLSYGGGEAKRQVLDNLGAALEAAGWMNDDDIAAVAKVFAVDDVVYWGQTKER